MMEAGTDELALARPSVHNLHGEIARGRRFEGGLEEGGRRCGHVPTTLRISRDNLTSDGRWTYTWDGENRLVEMKRDTSIPTVSSRLRLTFEYDHQGRRIGKQFYTYNSGWVEQRDTVFLYDGWTVVAELDANSSNAKLRSYVWGADLGGTLQRAAGVGGLLWVNNAQATYDGQSLPTGVHFVAYDGNGNVMALVKASDGSVSVRCEYGPFGEPVRVTGPLADAQPIRFSTKWTDQESGLLYYGYRYLNPMTGRWLNRDPMAESSGANIHAFAHNAPLGRIDVLGMADTDVPDLRIESSSLGKAARDPDIVNRWLSGLSLYLAEESGSQQTLDAWYRQVVVGPWSGICNSGRFGENTSPGSRALPWVRNTGRCCAKIRLTCEAHFRSSAKTFNGRPAMSGVSGVFLEEPVNGSEAVESNADDAIDDPNTVPTPLLAHVTSQTTWSRQRSVEWDVRPGQKRDVYKLFSNVSVKNPDPTRFTVHFSEKMDAACILEVLGVCGTQ